MSESARTQIFISYSRRDREWLDRFEIKLRHGKIRDEAFSIWSDKDLEAGENWRAVIESKLASASVALLLVSDAFLASKFIQNVELPAILEAAVDRGLTIFWVPLNFTTVKWNELRKYQACWPSDKPLATLKPVEQDRAIRDICDDILRHCRPSQHERDLLRQALRDAIPERLGISVGEPIAGGDYSVVYEGKQGKRQVVIKVLTDFPFGERVESFRRAAQIALGLQHPCFVKLRHAVLERKPSCLVMERVDAPTLQDALRENGPLPTDVVASLIAELAEAISEYHAQGLVYGCIYSSDVFFENGQRLRLSPAGVASFLSRHEGLSGCFPRSKEAATYATPEHYRGDRLSTKSDQYALGLLAFEMLHGTPPVTVRRLADFEIKREFFREPGAFAGPWRERHPLLACIVFRMLAENPDERYASLAELARALRDIETEPVAVAKQSYRQYCQGRSAFYADFYRRYFERCPEASKLFSDLPGQYAKLDKALVFLLNYEPKYAVEPTALTPTAQSHKALGLSERYFDEFGAALLDALRHATGGDDNIVRAWQTVIEPGLNYMKRACATHAPRLRVVPRAA